MTILTERDGYLPSYDLDPFEPLHRPPPPLRKRLRQLWSPSPAPSAARRSAKKGARRPKDTPASLASLESQLEHAVHEALRRPREPEAVSEPADLFPELDRRMSLIGVAGRFAAAIGVSAIAALFFVFMVPASRDFAAQVEDRSLGVIQFMKAALNEPLAGPSRPGASNPGSGNPAANNPGPSNPTAGHPGSGQQEASSAGGENGRPALCELQDILGPPRSQPAISHERSETLLQQFMQWQEKPTAASTH
jgi:hypothetical protein